MWTRIRTTDLEAWKDNEMHAFKNKLSRRLGLDTIDFYITLGGQLNGMRPSDDANITAFRHAFGLENGDFLRCNTPAV